MLSISDYYVRKKTKYVYISSKFSECFLLQNIVIVYFETGTKKIIQNSWSLHYKRTDFFQYFLLHEGKKKHPDLP